MHEGRRSHLPISNGQEKRPDGSHSPEHKEGGKQPEWPHPKFTELKVRVYPFLEDLAWYLGDIREPLSDSPHGTTGTSERMPMSKLVEALRIEASIGAGEVLLAMYNIERSDARPRTPEGAPLPDEERARYGIDLELWGAVRNALRDVHTKAKAIQQQGLPVHDDRPRRDAQAAVSRVKNLLEAIDFFEQLERKKVAPRATEGA